MASKSRMQVLHQPKISRLTKQQYRKYRNVRKLQSESLGQHELLCKDHKKYISKQLPISTNFLTLRPKNQTIYHFNEHGSNIYIFELLGEPLTDIWRQHQGQQLKEWGQKHGGFENTLLYIIKFCLKLYTESSISDILPECFRVSDGKLYYCYDTWMKGTYEIILKNSSQIENYFLSAHQLAQLQKTKSILNIQITYNQYLYKLALFILSLALPEVKIRNYDYYHLAISKANVEEKMRLFKIKITNKELQNLMNIFINYECKNMDQIWKLVDLNNRIIRGISPMSSKSSKNGILQRSLSRHLHAKQNSYMDESVYGMTCSKKSLFQPELTLNSSSSNAKKIRLRSRHGVSQLINLNHSIIHLEQKQRKSLTLNKRSFTLKQIFSKPPANHYTKILQYFGLHEHISQSKYQMNIIQCLEDIQIKKDWIHKIYQNGSIYYGQFMGDKRQGKGIYLFESQDFYYGDWQQNSIHGFGTYVFRSGECYYGQLRRGLKHGFGKFYYQDGRIYEGHWDQNVKFGFGTVVYPNSTKFLGFFQKNAETYGIFTWMQGNNLAEYYGNFSNYNWQSNQFNHIESLTELKRTELRKENESLISNFNGQNSKYLGECAKNLPEGYGIKQSQTEIYEGMWKKGIEDGQGKLTVKNKFEIEGKWREGVMLEYFYK